MNHVVAAAAGLVLDQPSFFSTLLKKIDLASQSIHLQVHPFPRQTSTPFTLQDVLECQEFYCHRTYNLSHFSMTF